MPRRNLIILLLAVFVAVLCHGRVATNRHGRILLDALAEIEQRYVRPVSPDRLYEGAMRGMVDQLDDPYSRFISADELVRFNETLNMEFGGVGMEVSQDPQTRQLRVVAPIYGTPAYQAGIRSGDVILRIDGRATQGLSLSDAVGLMRGPPGSSVSLRIRRPKADEPIEVSLQRERIKVDTVLGDTRRPDGSWVFSLTDDPQIGYVRISDFSQRTADDLRQVIEQLLAQGMRGLILDLRNDPGGLLDAAVDVSDMFINSGTIVSVERRKETRTFTASPSDTLPDFPMVVLVNRDSASEIVAACLKDHGRAKVAGERSYGKGTVQQVLSLEGELGALKLTTARYVRPNGRNIDRHVDSTDDDDWGVRPSPGMDLPLDDEEFAKYRVWRLRSDIPEADQPEDDDDELSDFVDRQRRRAVEWLRERIEQ